MVKIDSFIDLGVLKWGIESVYDSSSDSRH